MMSAPRPILTIFDDAAVRDLVADNLTATGKFRLVRASTISGATNLINAMCFDTVLLDIRLPDGDGIQFCSTLRSLGYRMPIILFGDGSADADVIWGLDAGANDYITNIARPKELIARIAAHLRIFDNSMDATLAIGSFVFRPSEKLLLSPQSDLPIRLTTKETDLLKFLHQARGSYVTRQRLLSEVWGYKTGVVSNTVDTHINRLRKKMFGDARCSMFIAMPGGYRLNTV